MWSRSSGHCTHGADYGYGPSADPSADSVGVEMAWSRKMPQNDRCTVQIQIACEVSVSHKHNSVCCEHAGCVEQVSESCLWSVQPFLVRYGYTLTFKAYQYGVCVERPRFCRVVPGGVSL